MDRVEKLVRENVFRIRYFFPICLLTTMCLLSGILEGSMIWLGIMISTYLPGIVISDRLFGSLDLIEKDLLVLPAGFGFYTLLSYNLGLFGIPFMDSIIITGTTAGMLILHYYKEIRDFVKSLLDKKNH